MKKAILTGDEVRIDYAKIVDPNTLEEQITFEGLTAFVIAAWVGNTRLIDNTLIQG